MKYTKAVQCDFCSHIELSCSKRTFKSWFKFLKWHSLLMGNGTTREFCSIKCYDNFKNETL